MVEWQLPKLYTAVRFRSPALRVTASLARQACVPSKRTTKGVSIKGFLKKTIFGLIVILPLVFSILNLTGCVTAPIQAPQRIERPKAEGIYHRVEKGQTLWRISKSYEVDLDELAAVNHISDATNIEVGQLIFIPNRKKQALSFVSGSVEDFIWPLKGRLLSTFNQTIRDMINKGINIQPVNASDIAASRSGRVVFSSQNFKGYGRTVIIDHTDGFLTVYARNNENLVKVGDYVHQGDIIAKAGSTGRDRNKYLHFEVRKNYVPKNPLLYLP